MLGKIQCFGLTGLQGYLVEAEVDVNAGLPGYEVVGLPDTAVKESKERVRSAIKNSCLKYPTVKITVNLAPASTKKEGASFDLGIAVGILVATEQVRPQKVKEYVFLGELSLDGSLRPCLGVLPTLISAREKGFTKFILPYQNANEASFIEGVEVYALKNLKEVVEFLNNTKTYLPLTQKKWVSEQGQAYEDFARVKGQKVAKRAMEIAVAGGHNILMIGPPGSGKTMLAKCVPTILPDMTFEEALEVTKIHSVAGVLDLQKGVVTARPFRAPHHTASIVALTGGGRNSKPGEISLAHNGVLFLDELPEYARPTIETLRQPLEDGIITVARANQTIEYPANFILVAAMNPCPCGNYHSKDLECTCTPTQIQKYLKKLSGPLLDRIDLKIDVDRVKFQDLNNENLEETSAEVKKRVDAARAIQLARFQHDDGIYCNAKMSAKHIRKYCKLDTATQNLMEQAFEKLKMSARGYTRILKVARTIADLEGVKDITSNHILEALSYRNIDALHY